MTVCRRYFELDLALRYIAAHKSDFAEEPDVIVVWARPELARLWYLEELRESGLITRYLTRPPLQEEGDGKATSHPESHNFKLGLSFVQENYANAYVIGQAADILPHDGTYRMIDQHMQEGAKAVLFHWANGCCYSDVWHTNLFGVCLDERYWPPLHPHDHADTLERHWGRLLANRELPGIVQSHNSNNKRFLHQHLSEQQAPWPIKPQASSAHPCLSITGSKSWWRRVRDVLFMRLW